jgi:hypothetical protein
MTKLFTIIMILLLVMSGCTKETSNPSESAIVSESWRKIGPVELGMSKTDFKKVSKIEPEYYHEAVQGETYAEIDIRRFPGVFPPSFYQRSDEHEYWIRCRFLEGVLFEISYFPPEKNAKELICVFTAKYGPLTMNEEWPNGLTWTRWVNNDTVLSICYVRVKGDYYPLNQPIGSTVEVQSADRRLRDKYLKLVEAKPKQ